MRNTSTWGVVITNKLLWKQHISKVVDKGKSALQPLRRLFAQKLVPLRIKRLVYTARVRSKLEYASQIRTTDKADAKALESIQHQALAWILKTNRNASVTALRTITGLPTMENRLNMMRLFTCVSFLARINRFGRATAWRNQCR